MKIESILSFLDEIDIDYCFYGDRSTDIEYFSSIRNYKSRSFTWVKNESMLKYLQQDIKLAFVQDGLSVNIENSITTKDSICP